MKRTLILGFGALALFAGAIAVGATEPWRSGDREREVAWLEAFASWSRNAEGRADCAESFDAEVGDPPRRLAAGRRIAREGCANGDLVTARVELVDLLIDERLGSASSRRSPELSRFATPLAGGLRPPVHCWAERDWTELSEEWALIDMETLRLDGSADYDDGSIHLAPYVCEPLHRFYAPSLNDESLVLADALVVLAHEAEHLRSPDASEADVECVALQRVRELVRAAGRAKPYAELMAGLAWDVGYPDMPEEYRTRQCRDGGPLDVRPETSVFP
jgi:hypothetical protein